MSFFLVAALAIGLLSGVPIKAAHAETIVNSVQLSHNNLGSVAVNPITSMVYVVDYTDGLVLVVDGSTNSLVASIPVPVGSAIAPEKVAVNPATNRVYVADDWGGLIVIDGATNKVTSTITFNGSAVFSVAANPNTNRIYALASGVEVLDGSTNQAIASVSIPNEGGMRDIEVNPVTNMVYVASAETAYDYNNVAVIDGSTNQFVKKVGFCSADAVAVDTATNTIFAANAYSGGLCVIDGSTNTITSTISLASYQTDIAANANLNRVYVHVDYTNQITVIDGASKSVIETVAVGTSPSHIAVNTANNLVYVSDSSAGTLYVLAPSTGSTSAKLTVNSQDASGQPINGFYTVLYQNGAALSTGFTPASFTVNTNQQYIIQVQDYGGYYFNHWLDNGSTDRNRSVSITSDTALAAVYSTTPSASPDFAITVDPASVTANPGSSASSTVTITSQNGFTSPVALGATSNAGISATFSPATVTPSSNSAVTSAMTLNVPSSVAQGTYSLTITGSSSYSLSHSTAVSVTVGKTTTGSSVAVSSVDASNNPISGYYTILYQNGAVSNTGFTPATFATISGQSYTAEVQDYGAYHFNHWSDNGSTNRDRVFTAGSTQQAFTAVYSTGSSSGGTTSQLSVQTFDSSGNSITGYYVSLWQNGNEIASGFSPAAFSINNNQQYQVAVADYGSESFSHWEGGSTDRFYTEEITGSASTSVILHAYYSP